MSNGSLPWYITIYTLPFTIQGGALGEYGDICTNMACRIPTTTKSYNVYSAARGTSCGDKKVGIYYYQISEVNHSKDLTISSLKKYLRP